MPIPPRDPATEILRKEYVEKLAFEAKQVYITFGFRSGIALECAGNESVFP